MRIGQQTHQGIIRKAAPLFNQKGYEGTALSDLKQELAREAFDHAWKLVMDTRFEGLADIPNRVDRLRGFCGTSGMGGAAWFLVGAPF